VGLTALLSLLTLAVALGIAPATARADSPFDGKWVQSPVKEEFTILKWQKECESPPVTGSTGGGESVRINTEGDELSFVGGGRVFKTNQCYDQMPTLMRETHSRNPSGREWRTRCATPPNDPRHAVMNTLVVATSNSHIDIIETGRYESQLAGGLCTADVKRSRSFDLVTGDTPSPAVAPPPAVVPKPAPPPPVAADPSRCTSPGEPSRLEARPSRKLLRTGESFSFRAIVLDAAGCATRTATTWALDDRPETAKAITVDANGKVTALADAPEGSYDAVVTAAGKSTHVTVEVASPSRYDALLQQSGLNDAGENDVASVAIREPRTDRAPGGPSSSASSRFSRPFSAGSRSSRRGGRSGRRRSSAKRRRGTLRRSRRPRRGGVRRRSSMPPRCARMKRASSKPSARRLRRRLRLPRWRLRPERR
jgi:hypothetical protein